MKILFHHNSINMMVMLWLCTMSHVHVYGCKNRLDVSVLCYRECPSNCRFVAQNVRARSASTFWARIYSYEGILWLKILHPHPSDYNSLLKAHISYNAVKCRLFYMVEWSMLYRRRLRKLWNTCGKQCIVRAHVSY